ncbi:MAG: LysR family transcriptional regulator, partial [Gluconacetobacter diazotrophicus]|nr:LysR family transcriptional regulator [Gluconacetobacter diazotrophicus]
DVAIRFGPLADSTLMARKLGECPRVIVASPEYLARHGVPARPEDLLDGHNCLGFNFRRAEPSWPFRDGDRRYALDLRGTVQANNGETLGQLAAAGIGIARVGAFSVAAAIGAGRLVTLLDAFNPGDVEFIHAVYVGGGSVPARVRAFVDFLAERLR